MKKTLLLSMATLVLSMFASSAKAETETKVLLDADFTNGIPEGWIVVGDVKAADGAALVAAGPEENYILSPELDLSVAGDAGIFKIESMRAGLTAVDAELGFTNININKEYDGLTFTCGPMMLTGVEGPYSSWNDAEGYNKLSNVITDNIAKQACESQKIRLKFFCPTGYAFKLKAVKVTCEVEKKADDTGKDQDKDKEVVLIEEDFSKFTVPSPADLSDANTDVVPGKYTNQEGWKAHGIIALEGQARLQSSKNYIQTPEFNFSGNSEGKFTVTCSIINPSETLNLFMYVKAKYVNAADEIVEVIGLDKETDKQGYYTMVGAGQTENITKHFILSKEDCPSQMASIYVHDYYNGTEFIIDDVKVSQIQDTTPTAIEAVVKAATETATYNVLGQKVNANAKGLVIKNGKVYLRK